MTPKTRVLVTGATGFVGRTLVARLVGEGWPVRAALRRPLSGAAGELPAGWPEGVETVTVGEIGAATDWQAALAGVDRVVHLAARVHVMNERGPEALARARAVNVEGSRRLAAAARAAGVSRFLLMSSVKAVGEGGGAPLTEVTPPAPADPYGLSKLEAEQALREEAGGEMASREMASREMEWVVLRPPLVYGPGVGANFLRLLQLSQRGWPLPLGAVRNRRSLVFVGNLADAVSRCLVHPGAANRCFFVHDGEPLAVPALIRQLADASGRPARLLAVPLPLLAFAARLLGAQAAFHRLAGSLEVDDAALRCATGWTPPFTTEAGLRLTLDWFLSRARATAPTVA